MNRDEWTPLPTERQPYDQWCWCHRLWFDHKLAVRRPANRAEWEVVYWPQSPKKVLSSHKDPTVAKVMCAVAASTGKYTP